MNNKNILKRFIFIVTVSSLSYFAIFSSAVAEETNTANLSQKKLACVGDSITFGARVKDRKKNAYPFRLDIMLGDSWMVRNFGVGGTTMYKTKLRRSYWRSGQLKKIADWQPDVVTIMLGTNDANLDNGNWVGKKRFMHDYKLMIAEFRNLESHPKIYLCLPPPPLSPERGRRYEVWKSDVLPAIRQVAKEEGLPVIDTYTPLLNHPKLIPDKVHPNAEGQKVLAETIFKALLSPQYNK